MSDNFANDPYFYNTAPRTRPRLWSLIRRLLAVIGVMLLFYALSVPAYQGARQAAIRAGCGSNLRQICRALSNYQEVYDCLPPAHTVDANGRPLHSWRTLILPYLDQESLYKSIDLSKPWNDPANAKALATAPSVFRCPVASGPKDTTTYLAIVGPNCCFLPTRPRPLSEITDPHISTIMLIEAGGGNAVPWMAPVDADESLVLGIGPNTKIPHPEGLNAAFVTGYITFLKISTPDKIRRALMSISGNDNRSIIDVY